MERQRRTITFDGNENEFTSEMTFNGLEQYRREFGNDQFNGVVILDRNKGWRKFGDNSGELEGDSSPTKKRNSISMSCRSLWWGSRARASSTRPARRKSRRQTGGRLEGHRAGR